MSLAVARLLTVARGGTVLPFPAFPTSWTIVRNGSNPIIPVSGGETQEQYDPAPYSLGSNREALIKGGHVIYRYKDSAGSLPFVGQNGGGAVISIGGVGAWDHLDALEAAVQYDSVAGTIYAHYKGSSDGTTWNWGTASAPDSTPNAYTKAAGNPILTAAAINTKMGGAGVTDTACFDFVLDPDGVTWHFYGYVAYNGTYQIVHMTGTAWNAPDVATLTVLFAPASSANIAATGSVFEFVTPHRPRYGMLYTYGPLVGAGRSIRIAKSDLLGSGWDFSDTTDVIVTVPATWESYHVYTPRILRENVKPFRKPILTGADATLFYSGADAGWVHSQTGLATIKPAAGAW